LGEIPLSFRKIEEFSMIFQNFGELSPIFRVSTACYYLFALDVGMDGDVSICTAGHVVVIDAKLSSTPSLHELSFLNTSSFEYRSFPGNAGY
jgi:hypothetical protein